MTVGSTTGTTGTTQTSTTNSSTALAKLSGDYTAFLKLLTAQLQNQDPLKPMDTKDFTQQLVQFANVEQSISTNKNLESLIQLQQAGQTAQATSYIGRTVESLGDTQATVDGKATWGYKLDNVASKVEIFVADKGGKVVYQGLGENTAGEHAFAWDGKDMNGLAVPAGDYTLRISAKDAANANVKSTSTVNMKVTGVEFTSAGPFLVSGRTQIDMQNVVRVKDAA